MAATRLSNMRLNLGNEQYDLLKTSTTPTPRDPIHHFLYLIWDITISIS